MTIDDEREHRASIREKVEHRFTGNRTKDLAGFSTADFAMADEVWSEVALRRYLATSRS